MLADRHPCFLIIVKVVAVVITQAAVASCSKWRMLPGARHQFIASTGWDDLCLSSRMKRRDVYQCGLRLLDRTSLRSETEEGSRLTLRVSLSLTCICRQCTSRLCDTVSKAPAASRVSSEVTRLSCRHDSYTRSRSRCLYGRRSGSRGRRYVSLATNDVLR